MMYFTFCEWMQERDAKACLSSTTNCHQLMLNDGKYKKKGTIALSTRLPLGAV